MENPKSTVTKCGANTLTENKEKSLSSWIVRASRMQKVSECSISDIRKMVAYIMIMVGFKEKPSESEDLVLIDFIKSRLSRFTIEEFKVAYTLFVEGKLDVEREHYNSFSTIYIARIMDSYARYRFHHLKDHEMQIESEEDEPKSLTTDDIEKLIIGNFERFLTRKDFYDFGGVQYRYLEQIGLIDLTREEKLDMMIQAKKIQTVQNTNLIGRVISSENDDAAVVNIARMIAITSYFEMLKKSNQHIAVIFQKMKTENYENRK